MSPSDESRTNETATDSERTFKLTVAYDGTDYCGWQRQSNGPSIQATLEKAICKLTGQTSVVTRASSRTDTGVHALGQVVSFNSRNWRPGGDQLALALNSVLPSDIVVRRSEDVPRGFHPIRDSIGKRYRYQIYSSRISDPLRRRFHWWTPRPLDVERMQRAAELIVGNHDFASFQTRGSPRQSTRRTVREIQVLSRQFMDGWDVDIEIEGDGFLYNMVRTIAGTLMQVGHDRKPIDWVTWVLQSKDRRAAGQTAPPAGLFLLKVFFREDRANSDGSTLKETS